GGGRVDGDRAWSAVGCTAVQLHPLHVVAVKPYLPRHGSGGARRCSLPSPLPTPAGAASSPRGCSAARRWSSWAPSSRRMTMEHAIKMRLSLPPTQVLEVDIQRVMKGGALRVAGCVEGEISVGRLALLRVLREQVYLNDWLEFSHFSQAFICARVKNVHFMNCFFRFQLVGREEIFLVL
ncbi:unnamed protein product, partial [Urochloa humidicola]